VSLNGSPSVYTTEATSNRLASVTNPARRFQYDNAGNTVSDSPNYTATYGLRGSVASITKAGVTGSYTYDADKRRVRKVTSAGPGSTIVFVYDLDGQLLGEYDQAGQALREYVWLGSTPVAVFTPDAANMGNPPIVYFIHADHLDTPRLVIDQNGGRRWRWLAEPFGTTAPETNPDSIGSFMLNLRFPGQYADAESGLWYNYFRVYDASLGRYVQSDPIGLEGGAGTYVYVLNQPTRYTDRKGLDPFDLHPAPSPPVWGPADVFFPGSGANDAFSDILAWLADAVRLPSRDSCKPDEYQYCVQKCGGPYKVDGCYVSVRWKTRRWRPGTGGYLKEEIRIVNCNCDDCQR
jgi:RHS repeat-associated protein